MNKKTLAKGEDVKQAQYASNHAAPSQERNGRLESGPQEVSKRIESRSVGGDKRTQSKRLRLWWPGPTGEETVAD